MDQSVTTSFRLPKEVDEELDRIAKDAGQSKGKWVRDLIMQTLQAMTENAATESVESKPQTELLETIEARLSATEQSIQLELAAFKAALEQIAKTSESAAIRIKMSEIEFRCIAASCAQHTEMLQELCDR